MSTSSATRWSLSAGRGGTAPSEVAAARRRSSAKHVKNTISETQDHSPLASVAMACWGDVTNQPGRRGARDAGESRARRVNMRGAMRVRARRTVGNATLRVRKSDCLSAPACPFSATRRVRFRPDDLFALPYHQYV